MRRDAFWEALIEALEHDLDDPSWWFAGVPRALFEVWGDDDFIADMDADECLLEHQ